MAKSLYGTPKDRNCNGAENGNGIGKSKVGATRGGKPSRCDYGEVPRSLDKDGLFFNLKLSDEQIKFRDAIWNPDTRIVFCDAPAGTGKSVIAIGTSIIMYRYGLYEGITYIVAPYAEQALGFMPGDLTDKISYYMEPLRQAVIEADESPMHSIIQESPESVKSGAYINAISHNFLRGQTLSKQIVILEEAQNYTERELRRALSRVKDDTKVIVIGHKGQIDLRNQVSSGFARCLAHFDGKHDARVAVCELTHNYRGFVSRVADEVW